ncbi:MAG: cell division protein FtsQ/DivIB [Nitrospiraceae bacterium]
MKQWKGVNQRARSSRPMWAPKRSGRSVSRWRPSVKLGRLGKWIGWAGLAFVAAGAIGWGGMQGYRQAQPILHDWLEVREVTIAGIHHLTREEILARLGLRAGETLWSVKPQALNERLLTHPWIKQASVTRSLPHELIVSVVERQPVALLKSASSALLLDKEGQVLTSLPALEGSEFPILVGVDLDRVMQGDDRARQLVRNGIRLAGLLGDEFDGLPEIDLGNPDNAVAYVQGLRFQFGPASFEEKWERYRKIDRTLHVSAGDEPANAKHEIDLRYPGKVIVRERG